MISYLEDSALSSTITLILAVSFTPSIAESEGLDFFENEVRPIFPSAVMYAIRRMRTHSKVDFSWTVGPGGSKVETRARRSFRANREPVC